MSIEFIWDTLLQIFQYATITKNKIEYNSVQGCSEAIYNNTGNSGMVLMLGEQTLHCLKNCTSWIVMGFD